jgi:chloride channel protein, CIC family
MAPPGIIIPSNAVIAKLKTLLDARHGAVNNAVFASDGENHFLGFLDISRLGRNAYEPSEPVSVLLHHRHATIKQTDSLKLAVEKMIYDNTDFLAVISSDKNILGVLSFRQLFDAYRMQIRKDKNNTITISLRRRRLKMLVKRNRLLTRLKKHLSS